MARVCVSARQMLRMTSTFAALEAPAPLVLLSNSEMPAPTKYAILGSGWWAGVHSEAIAASSSATCSAVWSRSEATVKKLLEDNKSPSGIETFYGPEGLDALLASDDVDAVVIALPISTVHEYVVKALQAGKHVISEKPVSKDVKTAKELIKRYESEFEPKGLKWRVAENWAHEPFIVKAQELIASGVLGPVLYWSLNFQACRNEEGIPGEWRRVPDYQGGFLLDGGVHFVAAIRCMLPEGDRPTTITSNASYHRTHLPPHDTIIGMATASQITRDPHGIAVGEIDTARLAPGVSLGRSTPSGTITLTFAHPDTPTKPPSVFTVVCEEGVVTVSVGGGGWTWTVEPSKAALERGVKETLEEGKGAGVEEEIEQFAKALQGQEGVNRGTPKGSLWDLAFIEACLNSNGQPIEIAA